MKKQKMKLEDLKVQSFVTSMEKTQKQTIDGGIFDSFVIPIVITSLVSAAVIDTVDGGNAIKENQLNSIPAAACQAATWGACFEMLC